jgi:hypothetical protein
MMTISGIDWASKIPHGGTYTVIAADDSANKAMINTGKADAVGCIVQVLRSGVDIGTDAKFSVAAGVISVEDGSTYKVSVNDVINWIVF